MLARSCLVYPADTVRVAMLEAFPNMLNDAANAAAAFCQLQTEAEKKG